MNKKAIWAIIGLMSAAVIGVAMLQMDLIRTSIGVNEEKFDKDVYEALNTVVLRLEHAENREIFNYTMNGFRTAYFQRELLSQQHEGDVFSLDFNLSAVSALVEGKLTKDQLLDKLMAELTNVCTCSKCVEERDQAYRSLMVDFQYRQGSSNLPLVERVGLEQLKTVLEQELSNLGIDTEYKYGVFSKQSKSFVMVNGHYVVEDAQSLPGYTNIYNSEYKVHLFPEDMPSPGLLMVYFPAKASFVWSSVWLNFLGSIFFTAIILLCFVYTINVIFRQKKISEMKTDFINNMTHEFKTPIATISLAADSITSPMISGKPEKVYRFADIIKQENKRMNSQVEKVLQMALIDKQDFTLKLSEVNLHEVIANAVGNIGLQVEKKNGTAKAYLEASQPIIQGDQTHISNIINNLLDNANKYSPENPEISVFTRNVPNGVEVIIEDNGIGMGKEVRKHIFNKFYRVHTGNLHDVKGFGLGLSYVKAIVTAHKGQIKVTSEPGKGSSFILTFPTQMDS